MGDNILVKDPEALAVESDKALGEFMKGYSRNPDMMPKLISALVKCMDRHPTLRLGQLLVGAMAKAGYDVDYLFNVYDERLIELLSDF